MTTAAAARQQPEGQQDHELVVQGVKMMLEGVLKDLQAEDAHRQQQALKALNDIAKKRTGQAFTAVQDVFRELEGFPCLVGVINAGAGPFRQESLIAGFAVDALVTLTRNNKPNVKAAIRAGAVDQLVRLIGSGEEAPISINVLKGVYLLMTTDNKGPVHKAILDAGGVVALIRMLDTVMLRTQEPDCSTWGREVATLLHELIRGNPGISSMLCDSGAVATTLKILSVCEDPLCMSLGLDILEEIVNSEDRTKIRNAMMAEGAVPALIRVMHVKGVGSKAALALAFMGEDPRHLPVLISVLDVEDIACLCHIAALAADAQDLDAGCCIEFIQLLIDSGSLHVLRCLVMARCLGVCLALSPLQSSLVKLFSSPKTAADACMLLDNASTYGRLEGALATMELLIAATQSPPQVAPFFGPCCSVMRRGGKVEAVVNVVLDEAAASRARPNADEDDDADNEVTVLLSELMQHLPTSTPSAADPQDAPSAAPSDVPGSKGAGFSSSDVNTKRYDSITFLVGGREFYALGWVLEQSSRRLRRLLAHTSDVKASVPVPAVEGLADDRMYALFTLAVEYAYTGWAEISADDALDLWAVAACLEMDELQEHCEGIVNGMLVPTMETLGPALDLAYRYRSGNRLRDLCVAYVLDNLMDMHESGRLANLLQGGNRVKLEEGIVRVLGDRFLLASKKQ